MKNQLSLIHSFSLTWNYVNDRPRSSFHVVYILWQEVVKNMKILIYSDRYYFRFAFGSYENSLIIHIKELFAWYACSIHNKNRRIIYFHNGYFSETPYFMDVQGMSLSLSLYCILICSSARHYKKKAMFFHYLLNSWLQKAGLIQNPIFT